MFIKRPPTFAARWMTISGLVERKKERTDVASVRLHDCLVANIHWWAGKERESLRKELPTSPLEPVTRIFILFLRCKRGIFKCLQWWIPIAGRPREPYLHSGPS